MTMLKDLNDLHKSMPEHAEAAAHYGLAMLTYHDTFFGVKTCVNFDERKKGQPLTDWKRLKDGKYDGERDITKKFREFCERNKDLPDFPEHERLVQHLFACCDARDKLHHVVTEQAREEYMRRMQELGKPLLSADYHKELLERIREHSEVIVKASKEFTQFLSLINSRK